MRDWLITRWYRLSHPLFALFWRIRKPVTRGVKVILTDDADQVLLVRTRYGAGWVLPGGGVHRGEAFAQAAIREVHEELRIAIVPSELRQLGVLDNVREGKRDTIAVFHAQRLDGEVQPGIELADTGWFDAQNLPAETSPATLRRLREFREELTMAGGW